MALMCGCVQNATAQIFTIGADMVKHLPAPMPGE